MQPISKTSILLTLAFLLSAALHHAHAEPKIHVNLSAKSFYVGEEFTYEILVSGAKKVEAQEPDGSDDLRIQFVEKINIPPSDPAQAPSVALRYRMIPMSPGTIPIPMFSIDADALTLMTDEDAFIDVALPEGYPGLTFARTLPTRDLYVGEPFRVDYVWTSPLPLSGYRAIQLYLPLFYESQFKVWSIHDWIAGDDKAAIGLPVSNTRLTARYGHREKGGTYFNIVSFSKIVVPGKAGEWSIRKASLLASYIEPPANQKRQRGWKTNYPSYFNNNFFEQIEGENFKKYYVGSTPQSLRVLPLPDAGKPHDFTGQVGKRSVRVTATPKVVAAGDPITLTIEVNDSEFPEVLELPALDAQVAFTRQFVIPTKQSRGRIEGKKKTYILTLRPRAQDVTAIPAIRLPYFDPVSKSYGVAESAPIPITVKAAQTATAFDAEVSGSGPLRNLLSKNNEGIRANFTQLSSGGSAGIAGMGKVQWLLILLILPPLGFLVFLRLSARHRLMRRDPVCARAIAALPQFKKSVASVERMAQSAQSENSLSHLDDAVRCYFSNKLNLVRHAHTYEELEAILRKKITGEDATGELLFDELHEIYTCCELGSYRGDGSQTAESVPMDHAQLAELIKQSKQSILTIDQKL